MTTRLRGRGRPGAGQEPAASDEVCLQAALEAFADLGYEAASVREVARRTGVSHGLLNARFGSKADLWKAAVDQEMGKLLARLQAAAGREAGSDPAEALKAVFTDFLLGLAESPGLVKLMNLEGARGGERLDYILDSFTLGRPDPLGHILAQGQASGRLRQASVPLVFMMLAHGGGAILALGPLATRLGLPPGEAEGRARQIAALLVDGLVPRAEPPVG